VIRVILNAIKLENFAYDLDNSAIRYNIIARVGFGITGGIKN